MAHRIAASAFVLGVLILAVGVFVSPLVGAAENDAQAFVEATDNDSVEVQQNLNVTASINATNGNATVTVQNTATFAENATSELATGESETVTVDGENVTVRNDAFSDPEVVLKVTYNPTFGFSETLKLFYANLGFMLTVLGFLFVVGGLGIGVRGT